LSKKILVIRFSSIGDIVLTTPVVRALHEQLGAEVHFLTKGAFASILHHNPHISKVITLAEDFDRMIADLKEQQYDHIIDLHHNLRTKRIKLSLRRPATSFHKLNFKKWLLVRTGINRLPDVHIVDRYMATGAALGLMNDGKGLDFFIPAFSEVDTKSEFGVESGSFVAIVIGAAHQTKCLTISQITGLCNKLDRPVILLGGKEEISKAEEILNSTTNPAVKSACGKFDILQSGSIIKQAGLVITHDTGLMHIASALNKPQIVIWGNTIPEFGMYPYYGAKSTKWISIEQKGLACRPCSKIGFEECPKGHFKCILDHDIEHVAKEAASFF
jgi:ADP-heptose:LPS heptosyltransferase